MIKAVYIHIPFCEHICSYCDFCKMFYYSSFVDQYLEALEKEIKEKYEKEEIETLYIGGGTPSCLSYEQLKKLFSILKIFHRSSKLEFTVECNIENIDKQKLELFYQEGVNRLSIGMQTFHPHHLKTLQRNHTKKDAQSVISLAKKLRFQNINVDLMYALPGETLEEVMEDVSFILSLNVPHVSTYSLMIEPHTKLFQQNQKPIDEDLDAQMYEKICEILTHHGYEHYEISNFSKPGFCSKHNLTYWNNEPYYGFGLGASGYIKNIRYENTKSFQKYIRGSFLFNEETMDDLTELQNTFLLGFRKIKGISKKEFYQKYSFDLHEINKIRIGLEKGYLEENKEYIYIKKQYIYESNEILLEFLDIERSKKNE